MKRKDIPAWESEFNAKRDKIFDDRASERAKAESNKRSEEYRAEIERREALTPEERAAEDKAKVRADLGVNSNFKFHHLGRENLIDVIDMNERTFDESCEARGIEFNSEKIKSFVYEQLVTDAYYSAHNEESGNRETAKLFRWLIKYKGDLNKHAEKLSGALGSGVGRHIVLSEARKILQQLQRDAMETADIKVMSGADLFENISDDREPIITPFLCTRESAAVWAQTGKGKTWFTLSLAMAAAGGEEFGDMQGHGVPVLYLDGEMYANDLRERMAMIIERQGWDKDKILSHFEMYLRTTQEGDGALNLNYKAHRDKVVDMATSKGCKLLVLDNLATLWPSDNENDATSFNLMNDFIAECRTKNLGVLIVDHSNKLGTDMRGSSNKKTVLNVCCGLKPIADEQNRAKFTLVFDKWRGAGCELLTPKTYTFTEFGWTFVEDKEASLKTRVEVVYYKLVNGQIESIEMLRVLAGSQTESSFENFRSKMSKLHKDAGNEAKRKWYEGYFMNSADPFEDDEPDF